MTVNGFLTAWNAMARTARVGVAIGAALVLALALGVAFWACHPDYQVLFSELSSADAAAMTAELDRIKTPYQLADGGNTILVPKDIVYKTRLKLMGKDLPLRGAVGFEVFNNADFGMTDFVQKVNYQRAVQGELTRTILSIEDVQSARVHLAIPEQGMFKKAVSKSKASVTLVMKLGRTLASEQIAGIQRLVAASVADVMANDVTVLDQHGIALTRVASADGATDSGLAQLDSRRSVEEYLLRKVTQVLDRTFGPGGAIASVDVALNLDQSRVTTEDVLPAKNSSGDGNPTGVVVRERQTVRGDGTSGAPGARDAQSSTSSVVESDYQVGRRVEHLVTAPGSTRRLTIAVVVRKPLSDAQAEKLKELIGLATGLDSQRGDAIAVVSMDRFATPVESGTATQESPPYAAAPDGSAPAAGIAEQVDAGRGGLRGLSEAMVMAVPAAIVMFMLAIGALRLWRFWCFWRGARGQGSQAQRLSATDRERLLLEVRQWVAQAEQASVPLGNPR
jgi:flagellar M-ring protein FliF